MGGLAQPKERAARRGAAYNMGKSRNKPLVDIVMSTPELGQSPSKDFQMSSINAIETPNPAAPDPAGVKEGNLHGETTAYLKSLEHRDAPKKKAGKK